MFYIKEDVNILIIWLNCDYWAAERIKYKPVSWNMPHLFQYLAKASHAKNTFYIDKMLSKISKVADKYIILNTVY